MVRFAIMGLGYIASRVAQGIQYAKNAQLYAVASRDIKKANSFKEQFHAQVAYGSYLEMLEDDKVDIVYICTPNHLHYSQIKLCFSYHKHVICEKPMVRSIQELDELYQLSILSDCILLEAHKTCFTPLNQEIYKRLKSGQYGHILSIEADYSYDCKDQYDNNSWAMHPEYGGSSYDVGVYPVCFCNFMADSQIQNVNAYPVLFENQKADYGMMTMIQYKNGVIAQANCSWLYYTKNKGMARIVTTRGTIEIDAFWKGTKARIDMNGIKEECEVEMDSDFTGEVEEACSCVIGHCQSSILSYHASKEILKVIEAVNSYRLKGN